MVLSLSLGLCVLYFDFKRHGRFALWPKNSFSKRNSPLTLVEAMDQETNDSDPRRSGSFGQTSSAGSSLRRYSLSLSGAAHPQIDDDIESETVSQAGDIGDVVVHSNRYSESGIVAPVPVDIISPLSADPIVYPADKNQEIKKELPRSLEYISYLVHLAVFGILGVLTRYLLRKLFGPGVAGVTSDQSILYPDLPSNVVGSFLMGWWGVVFKQDISSVSDYLAIGLTTGYLGSLTTFSGWNQEVLDLSVDGQWVSSVLGFPIGLSLAACSIVFGVETAKGFKWLLKRLNISSRIGIPSSSTNWRADSYKRNLTVLVVLVLILGLLWFVSGTLERREFNSGGSGAQLWLACIVGPVGVWIRWFLARLNGRGLGRAGLLKWVPFGTLMANVSAACVMAALSTLMKAVHTKTCDTVATGIQFGLLGCLSTVSTFIAEFYAMGQSTRPWRAYAYAAITIVPSFTLGTLIYSVPVWTKGYG